MDDETEQKQALARDINHLVTLASTTNVEPLSERHRVFANCPADKFAEKFTVQDAVATILLDGRPGELYAVGIQLDQDPDASKRAVVIYISTNQKVTASKTIFLEDIWNLLQKRAKDYELFDIEKEKFEREHPEEEPDAQKARPPTMPQDTYHSLMRLVYRQCFKRWLKWIHQSYDDMSRFKAIMVDTVGDELEDFNPKFHWWLEPLTYLIEQYDWVCDSANLLTKEGRDPASIVLHPDFPAKMDRLESAYRVFEQGDDALKIIEDWGAMIPEQEEPILSHLRHFVELHIAINTLERVAQSGKAPQIFSNKSLEVVYVDDFNPQPIPTALPIDTSGWEAVLTQGLAYRNFAIKPEYEAGVQAHFTALGEISSKRNNPCRVTLHPPIQLLQFFTTHRIHPPPFTCIGSSQPICAACSAVFAAWNTLYEYPSFISRRSSGQFPFPWNVPTEWVGARVTSDVEILDAIYRKIAERFGSALFEAGMALWGEAGTSASGEVLNDRDAGQEGHREVDGQEAQEMKNSPNEQGCHQVQEFLECQQYKGGNKGKAVENRACDQRQDCQEEQINAQEGQEGQTGEKAERNPKN
ncbi:hypothetical protein DIZ76_011658 [Coccidioides immitis]|nr:hypothetical protein DIZ76_011658 [Coccidioides immitis]